MSLSEENKQIIVPVLKGLLTFLTLFCLLTVVAIYYDFSQVDMQVLSYILAVTCAVFLANNIYDVAISEIRLKTLAEKRAQILIASSQQLFMEVYDNSPVAYVVVGEYGHVVSANAAAARLFGQPAEQLATRDLFTLMNSGEEEHQSVLKQKFKHGINVSDEDVMITHGTAVSWTKVSIFKFSSTDGKKLSLVTFVDVTKQKEIDVAKTEFVSLASHQLRTPISGMRWSAELLLMDGVETLSLQQKRYIDRLLSSIQRMSGLVDDFLQVSRFDLGTRVLKLEDVVLPELCDDVIAEQTELVTAKRIKIKKEYDSSILKINTDLGLLRIIVTNLTVNAVKYSRIAGEVNLSYRRVNSDLEIEVKDTGIGIPLGEQARVFSKIFRASNAIKEVPDGTGLGLYIVKKAVEQMRGRISFVSSEDEGTTFTVVIPGSF